MSFLSFIFSFYFLISVIFFAPFSLVLALLIFKFLSFILRWFSYMTFWDLILFLVLQRKKKPTELAPVVRLTLAIDRLVPYIRMLRVSGRSPRLGRSTAQNNKNSSSTERSPVVRPTRAGRPPNFAQQRRETERSPVVRPEGAERSPSVKSNKVDLGRSFAEPRRTTAALKLLQHKLGRSFAQS